MNVSVLLVSGSLRHLSTNTALVRTAARHAPPGVSCETYDGLAGLPHFNPDDDQPPLPPAVLQLRGSVQRADAILFSVPEYAGALPGSFKNLLDWTIGDPGPRSIYEKPVAWLNASPRGAVGAHDELRTVLTYASARIIDAACLHMPVTAQMIGRDGYLSDDVSGQMRAVFLALARETHKGEDRAVSASATEPSGMEA